MKKITISPEMSETLTRWKTAKAKIDALPLSERLEGITNHICGFSPESIAYMKKLDREKAAKRQQQR
jgi:hypothetical protein